MTTCTGSPLWLPLLVALVASSCAAPFTDEHPVVPETDFVSESEGAYDRYAYNHKEFSIRNDVAWESKGPTADNIARSSGLSLFRTVKNLQNEVKKGQVYEHKDGRFEPLPHHVLKKLRKHSHSIVDEVKKQFGKSSHYGDGKKKAKKKKKKKKPLTAAELAKQKEEGKHWAVPWRGKNWVNDVERLKPKSPARL